MEDVVTISHQPRRLLSFQNHLLPLLLFVSLLAVAALNAFVQFRGQRLEKRIAAARPAREFTRRAEIAIGLEMSALHSYALTRDPVDIARFQTALHAEDLALSSIQPGQRGLSTDLVRRVESVQQLTRHWHALVMRVDGRQVRPSSNAGIGDLVAEEDLFRRLLNETDSLDGAIASTIRQHQSEQDALELLDSRSTVLLCLIALLAGGGMLWLSRRVHFLALQSEMRRREIEKVMAEKAQLTRGLSHDLRNPLGSVQGFAQLIEDSLGENETARQKEMFARLQRAVRACLAILSDVVDLSRVDVGSLPLEIAPIEIGRLLAEIAEDAQPDAQHAQLHLHLEPLDDLPVLHIDERRVRQIVGNLVSNAIKYTPAGGHVRLRAVTREPDMLVVEVSDTGPGIPEAEREKIFDEFYRMDGSSQRANGFGVGLAISRKLARLMGGEVDVDGNGKGSTFSLRLPIDR
jgi:signal transduction histidine kinase